MENGNEKLNNHWGSDEYLSREAKDKTEDNLLADDNSDVSRTGQEERGFVGLERKLGLVSGICLIVGTMIGSGIFASPRYVMENSGSVGLTLIVWSLCGVLAISGALSYAELGTMIPLSGAEYVYLLEGFGALPAFLYSWTSVIVLKPSQVAIICLAFGAYVIEPIFPGCGDRENLQPAVKLLAAIAIGEYKTQKLRYCAILTFAKINEGTENKFFRGSCFVLSYFTWLKNSINKQNANECCVIILTTS